MTGSKATPRIRGIGLRGLGLRGLAGALAAVGLAATLSGCHDTVAGIAQPGEIDISTLDVGSYPIQPVDIYADYRPDFYDMDNIAAMRLADHVATSADVDPRLIYGGKAESFSAGVMDELLGSTSDTENIARRNKMLFGFKSEGGDRPVSLTSWSEWPKATGNAAGATTVNMVVMQFPDAESAQRSAREFADTDVAKNEGKNQPIALGEYPDAQSHWQPGNPVARSFLAHGSYVAAAVVSTPRPDASALATLTEKTYETQLPLLDTLPPISDEQILHLPWDQDHILSRTLNPDEDYKPGFTDYPAIYGRRGMLQTLPYRGQAAKTFESLGADRFAVTDSAVLARTENAESAERAVTEHLSIAPMAETAEAPPDVPNSTCVENKTGSDVAAVSRDKRFTCIVAYRQYVSYLTADQLLDAHQRSAAQYALLANSAWQS